MIVVVRATRLALAFDQDSAFPNGISRDGFTFEWVIAWGPFSLKWTLDKMWLFSCCGIIRGTAWRWVWRVC